MSATIASATKPHPSTTSTIYPLETISLTKSFAQGVNTVTALREVSLRVGPGEFAAVMGSSGSGKSTLLHVMAGLTRPDRGSVLVEGQDLSALPDWKLTDFRRRRIGLVFQQFNLIPALTSLENVMLPLLAERGGDKARIRALAITLLERLGLKQRMEHRPDALSGGEQQRVAIARALVTDPAIIMADEPTGSLDSVNGKAICSLLKELNETEHRTIIVVTHEPAVAAWARRILVMRDGAFCADLNSSEFSDAHALAQRYQDIMAG